MRNIGRLAMEAGLLMALNLVLLSGSPTYGGAAPEALSEPVHEVRRAIDEWDPDRLVKSVETMENVEVAGSEACGNAFWQDYWTGVAGLNAILCARGEKGLNLEMPDGTAVMQETRDSLERALRARSDDGECHAMLAVLLGLGIREKPWTGIWKGPSLMRHRKAALAAIPESPRTVYLLGTASLETADSVDDLRRSVETLGQAVLLFEAEQNRDRQWWEPDWGYAHALVFLGEGYRDLGDWNEAEICFVRALEINPRLDRAQRGLDQCRNRTEKTLS